MLSTTLRVVVLNRKVKPRFDRPVTVFEAANRNDIQCLKQALEGEYGEVRKEDLDLALLRSAVNGNLECLQLILKYSPDIDATDGKMETALMCATRNKDLKMVLCLIDAGCNVNMKNADNYNALTIACEVSDLTVMELLLSHGADYHNRSGTLNITLLMETVIHSSIPVVQKVLSLGIDVNGKGLNGDTALHFAVVESSLDILKVLLEAGADVNVRNVAGQTPLMIVVKYKYRVEIIELLLKAGADVKLACKAGRTCLHYAVRTMSGRIMELLIGAGADVNAFDHDGNVPLCGAVIHKNYAAIKALLQAAASVQVTCCIGGFKPLSLFYAATKTQNTNIMEVLYQAGAGNHVVLQQCLRYVELEGTQEEKPEVPQVLKKYLTVPNSLMGMCRQVIRGCISSPISPAISDLELPSYLRSYLQFCDIFDSMNIAD